MSQGDMEYDALKNVGLGQGDMEYGVLIFAEAAGAPPAGGIWVRVAGVWTAVVSVWTKVSGTWKEIDLSARVGGSWELIHQK